MGKTRRRGGGNNNLGAINSSLFVNKRRGVNFISSPMIQEYELNENVPKGTKSGKWTSMTKYPQQFKSESAEIKNMRRKAPGYGMSKEEINNVERNIKNQWHTARNKNRRLAVRLGNINNMAATNIAAAEAVIKKQNNQQTWAANYAKFIQNTDFNTLSNVPKNIRNTLKMRLPKNFSQGKINYFTKKINANFR